MLKAGEGDNRGWDGWMASPTRWTWVWASSGNWWWTGKPSALQSMGSQRVRHDWVTELTEWAPRWGCCCRSRAHFLENRFFTQHEGSVLKQRNHLKCLLKIWFLTLPQRFQFSRCGIGPRNLNLNKLFRWFCCRWFANQILRKQITQKQEIQWKVVAPKCLVFWWWLSLIVRLRNVPVGHG